MDIQKAIEERHSVRRFLDKPIEGEALERLEAAIAEANRESGLHIQLVRDEPGAFTGLLAHYGRFRGVSNYLALVGRKSSELEETVGYYGERIVLEAEGEAQRFISVYDQYAKAPGVTRERLFIETMEQVLKGANKVIVEQGNGQGVVPYLPLPELQKRTAGGNQ